MEGIENLLKNKKGPYIIKVYSFSNGAFLDKTNPYAEFAAFITDYSDSYKSEWKKENVFGKMDPISTFKNTTRTISLAFDIPNESVEEAALNMQKVDYIIRGLYPIYSSGVKGTRIMSSPPMFRVKFANLVTNVNITNSDSTTLRDGLLCYMDGFDFKPKVDNGFFIDNNIVYPKLLSAVMNLNIIHEHPLGNIIGKDGKPTPRINIGKFPHNYSAISNPPAPSGGGGPAGDTPPSDAAGAPAVAAVHDTTKPQE